MNSSSYVHSLPPLLLLLLHHLFLLYVLVFISTAQAQTQARLKALNSSISAILVFGDSTADPGNNNYVSTAFKSNFPPYGRDFVNHMPTGRFSNGRLVPDFIASYMGIKDFVPPYLDPMLSFEELMTGVSFASAGCGFDPLTPSLSSVLLLSNQLEYFREYKSRLELVIGKERTEDHIKKAVYVVSAGTNDFVVNYFTIPVRRKSYSFSSYEQFLLQQVQQFFQGLWAEGARRIVFAGLPPIGCLPIVITLRSNNALLQRGCVEYYSAAARDYNQKLQNELKSMQSRLAHQGARIAYVDLYNSVTEIIKGQSKFGFDDVSSGCCGTGFIEAAFLCNPHSFVCPDASKYVFWDAIHPTERAYYLVFQTLLSTIDAILKD